MAKKEEETTPLDLAVEGFKFGGKFFDWLKNRENKKEDKKINQLVENNTKASENFGGPNTPDIPSMTTEYFRNAMGSPLPRSISSGDDYLIKMIKEQQEIIESMQNERNNLRYYSLPKSNYRIENPSIIRQRMIENASPLFTRGYARDSTVIIKAISGMVASMGGDSQISEFLTLIVMKGYPTDAANIYNFVIKEDWEAVGKSLFQLVQKLNMDQDIIISQMENAIGKQKTRQFANQWKQQQEPYVGAAMIAGNMIHAIKGIITPTNLR